MAAPVGPRDSDLASRSEIVKVAAASLIGTSIEWYDFFLYGTERWNRGFTQACHARRAKIARERNHDPRSTEGGGCKCPRKRAIQIGVDKTDPDVGVGRVSARRQTAGVRPVLPIGGRPSHRCAECAVYLEVGLRSPVSVGAGQGEGSSPSGERWARLVVDVAGPLSRGTWSAFLAPVQRKRSWWCGTTR